ncbi:hypothetical protein FCM35_KLT08274 [Carex littledalei]|uniref:Uncharacterized protein n=1 Tax=Carex littledalei TaxID=544730 RepID=A0A833QXK3_9POAL|nr:hypothetical protein FCM35_KLT08274 [Carex littledalei]
MPPPSSPPAPAAPSSTLHATTLPSPPFPSVHSITSILPSPPPFTSLAVFLSDSTALLYPSLPLLTPSSSSPPITLPSPSIPSLSTFSFIQPSNSLLFISFSPRAPIAYHLNSHQFTPIPLQFKPDLFSPLLPFGVGLGFRVKSSQNMLAIHSIAASQIWLLFVSLKEKSGAMVVELKKCAVLELVDPVYDMCVGLGCLVLGERGGVRVFHLRSMIKGKEGRGGDGTVKKGKGLINGMVDFSANKKNCKLRTVKVKQNSGEYFSFFVSFNEGSSVKSENENKVPQLARAVSIHPFSKKTFMVLDSAGDLHFFNVLNNSGMGPNSQCNMKSGDFCTTRLDVTMKMRLLAVPPNFSTKAQIIWLSDGHHLLNMVSASGMKTGTGDSDITERKQKSVAILATETIFMSEKIRDIVPILSSTVLVLTQAIMFEDYLSDVWLTITMVCDFRNGADTLNKVGGSWVPEFASASSIRILVNPLFFLIRLGLMEKFQQIKEKKAPSMR